MKQTAELDCLLDTTAPLPAHDYVNDTNIIRWLHLHHPDILASSLYKREKVVSVYLTLMDEL